MKTLTDKLSVTVKGLLLSIALAGCASAPTGTTQTCLPIPIAEALSPACLTAMDQAIEVCFAKDPIMARLERD